MLWLVLYLIDLVRRGALPLSAEQLEQFAQVCAAGRRRVRAMDTRTLEWNWRGETIRLGAGASGSGPMMLLLPALSSISSSRSRS